MFVLKSIGELQAPIEEMWESNITIAPWLVYGEANTRISGMLTKHIVAQANSFARTQFKRLRDQTWTEADLYEEHLLEAYFEIVTSTAIYLSHIELGTLAVTDEMVFVAERLLRQFIENHGIDTVMRIHMLMVTYEDLQVIRYFKEMPVKDFLAGHLHRPWQYAKLDLELREALRCGVVDEVQDKLRLTPKGEAVLKEITKILEESRFLKSRSKLMRIHGFNSLDDYEELFSSLNPTLPEQRRRQLVEWCHIQPGMDVLELGCGTGLMTFNAGLYEAVGSAGTLTATDPAIGMLSAAKVKKEKLGASWVEIRHARAEKLPFPDGSFDRVTGYLFLHFTNIEQAFQEIVRVLKPGGIFATGYPLHFPHQSPFFAEWFEPLFVRLTGSSRPDILPSRDTVPSLLPKYFNEYYVEDVFEELYYTNPSNIVRFFVDVVNVFEDAVKDLPWQARQDMVADLVRRGQDIQRKYPQESLVERHPGQLFWAKKS